MKRKVVMIFVSKNGCNLCKKMPFVLHLFGENIFKIITFTPFTVCRYINNQNIATKSQHLIGGGNEVFIQYTFLFTIGCEKTFYSFCFRFLSQTKILEIN
jgi:hypothetical protein